MADAVAADLLYLEHLLADARHALCHAVAVADRLYDAGDDQVPGLAVHTVRLALGAAEALLEPALRPLLGALRQANLCVERAEAAELASREEDPF
jgi:hypothetical protein